MSVPEPIPAKIQSPRPVVAWGGGRFVRISLIVVVLLYLLLVGAAYGWFHVIRGNAQVRFLDVALFRVRQLRHAIAEQQFTSAREELGKKNYRAAYLAFATAIRKDPDNVPGRIEAAEFFRALGSVKMEISTLEEGLARTPGNTALANRTFALLTATGRDRNALDLMHRLYGDNASGESAPLVETYRILATLNIGDEEKARVMLADHPEIRRYALAQWALADVLWKSKEKLAAIEILAVSISKGTVDYQEYAKLAQWEELGGLADDAVATARKACSRFPGEVAPRVLLIEMLANQSPSSPDVQKEAQSFLKESKGQVEAVAALAELAGRKGWVDLERSLYLAAANRQPEMRMLALFAADALAASSRTEEELQVLKQVEAQSEDANPAFAVQLRRREVMAAGVRGDHDALRENSRFLAAAVQASDPDSLETYRRLFVRLGYKEAAAAFPNP